MQPKGKLYWEVGVFLALTFALSAIFYFLIITSGGVGGSPLTLGLMWCPGLAAMAVSLIYRRSLRGLGWRLGPARWLALGYLLPVVYAGLAYGGVWLTGLGRTDPAFSLNPAVFLIAGTISGLISGVGEEIGWRGFLVPRLAAMGGFTRAALLSGAIWAMWHYPILLFGGYNNGTPWWYGLLCFTVLVLGISFAFAWLRLKSGSLWPAALLHASHNLFIQGLLDPMTVNEGLTRFWISEFGAALAIAAVIVGYIFWKRGAALGERAHPDQPPAGLPAAYAGR